MKERPVGISIIAVAYILLAIFSLVWSGIVFGVGGLTSLFGGLFGADTVSAWGASSGWAGFVGIFAAILQFVIAFGLLAMKRWAWFLALIGVAITVIQGLIGVFSGGPFAFMCGILGLLIPIGILVYLLLGSTRQAFGIGGGE
ncbi:MAG: hypothetical protein PVF77_15720 [Anaerolineae bacterium]|jgi:hypothetical protein